MREFLRYLYTGKLSLDIAQIMGILRIASFFGMEEPIESVKVKLADPTFLNAYDLCIMYCEVRDYAQDFDDMKMFLTELIPKRLESHMICSILKEIWINPNQNSNEGSDTKENASASGLGSLEEKKIYPEPDDLQEILIQKIQNTIDEILDDPVVSKDLFDLPKDALTFIFSSSETCICEFKLF